MKIRYILQYYFDQGHTARLATEKICAVYGPDTLSNATARRWFKRFRKGEMKIEDQLRSGRPTVDSDGEIMAIVESDRHVTTRSIAKDLKINQKTVWNHLRKAGLTKKLGVWVPHKLSQRNLLDRIDACDSLLKRNEFDPFLKRMVTGDEKWVTYENIRRHKSWCRRGEAAQTIPKPGLTAKKVLLSVWWDYKGIIYYELLQPGQTLNSDLYCQQLNRLKRAIDQKRPELANRKGIVFHHDNARPHTSLATRQKLKEFDWEVLPQPPYSPDLAPSDFHLFKFLQNYLSGKNLNTREACEIELGKFFNSRDENFFKNGILKLPKRWAKVVQSNGAYIP